MPELPEVETIRRDLEHVLLGKDIIDVRVPTPRLVKGDRVVFLATLIGNRFERIGRTGKLLHFALAHSDRVLHIHLKMTGQLICQVAGVLIVGGHPQAKIEALPNQYTHLVLTLEDGTILYFNDVRTFGYAKLMDADEHEAALRRFGMEPIHPDFTWEWFSSLVSKRRGVLKAFLLNQQLIAGIGNIYADEICFRARLRPQRRLDTLSVSEIKRLYVSCKTIISKAVEKRGTTFSNFVDAAGKKGGYKPYLMVYGRGGERCRRCGSTDISKTVLGGRGTAFCSLCQR